MTFLVKIAYCGPTDKRGSRLTASHFGNRVSVPFNHALSGDARRLEAAQAFCNKFGYKIVTNEVVTYTSSNKANAKTEYFVLCSR